MLNILAVSTECVIITQSFTGLLTLTGGTFSLHVRNRHRKDGREGRSDFHVDFTMILFGANPRLL